VCDERVDDRAVERVALDQLLHLAAVLDHRLEQLAAELALFLRLGRVVDGFFAKDIFDAGLERLLNRCRSGMAG